MSDPSARLHTIKHFFSQGGAIQTEDARWLIQQAELLENMLELVEVEMRLKAIITPDRDELQRLSEPT